MRIGEGCTRDRYTPQAPSVPVRGGKPLLTATRDGEPGRLSCVPSCNACGTHKGTRVAAAEDAVVEDESGEPNEDRAAAVGAFAKTIVQHRRAIGKREALERQ